MSKMREKFDPPIRLNLDALPEYPPAIATRREAATILELLPACGIQWCGVVGCLERSDIATLRRALANALERYGFLSPTDVDAERPRNAKENLMVSRLGIRDMQVRRGARANATTEERAMETVARKPIKARGERFEAAAELFWREADAMHSLLIERADALVGCTEGSAEDAELERLADVIEAYETKRWPSGKTAVGKG